MNCDADTVITRLFPYETSIGGHARVGGGGGGEQAEVQCRPIHQAFASKVRHITLRICLSVCLSVRLSVCLSVRLSVYLSV